MKKMAVAMFCTGNTIAENEKNTAGGLDSTFDDDRLLDDELKEYDSKLYSKIW